MVEWIVIYETNNPADAHVVAERLKVEGIAALVHRQAGASAFGITVGPLGEVSVLVRPEDHDRALDILKPDEVEALPDTTGDIIYLDTDWSDDDAQ